jgi:hypothetical protein
MAPAMSLAKAAVPVGVRQLSHRQQARKVSGVRRPHRVASPVIAAASRSSKGVNAVSGSVDIPALKGAFPNVIPEVRMPCPAALIGFACSVQHHESVYC